MSLDRFQRVMTSTDELTELIGVPSELALKKQLTELDGHMQSFIAQSPFLLLGTFGREGGCDVSPRGDACGLVQVLDAKTLVIADRRGNRRVDSLRNILETGRIGLLFLIPGLGETLRINGRACLIRDDDILNELKRKQISVFQGASQANRLASNCRERLGILPGTRAVDLIADLFLAVVQRESGKRLVVERLQFKA